MSGKISSVAFHSPIHISNSIEDLLIAGRPVDGRPIRLDLVTDSRGLLVHWSDHKGKKFANLVPWAAIKSIVLDMEDVAVEAPAPAPRGPGRPRIDPSRV